MATVSSPRAAPAALTRGLWPAARRALPAIATVAGVAATLRLLYDATYLNYDARYALLWARDLTDGLRPDYTAAFAPTPHPLQTAVSALALPFADPGEAVLWLALGCFGALVWLVFRLGSELFNPWVGAVTAVVVATRPALHRDVALGYQDVPFAALVLGAVLLEARSHRRGEERRVVPVLGLLALAGLLRPEAWVLSGLYLVLVWRGLEDRRRVDARRLGLVALTVAGPVVWALTDLLVTGDPLHSLHGTAALAAELDRRREVGQVPYWGVQYIGFALREPVVAALPLGLAFAWLHRRRPAVLPVAVVVALALVFAVGPLFGLPLIGRYLRTPAILLALFYGLAVAGWTLLPDGPARRRWLVVGVLALVLSLVYLPRQIGMLSDLDRRFARDGELYGDLRLVGESQRVRDAVGACGAPLAAADHRPVPFLRFWLGGPPGSVTTVERSGAAGTVTAPAGLLLVPRRNGLATRFYRSAFPDVRPPAGARVLYVNRSYRVFASGSCGTRASR